MRAQLEITLDRSSPVPLYHQVASAFEEAIREGTLPSETKLENEVALARRYNLSRPTMRQAMDQLVRNGLVVRRRGVGTQVIGPQVRRNLRLTSLYNDLVSEGADPETEVLSFEHVDAPEEIAQQLKIATGDAVCHLRRLRLLDGRPLALMENWVPTNVVQLDEAALEKDGLYNILRRSGIDFRMAHQRVGATAADDDEAELLGCEQGSALVLMERTAFDSRGVAVECGHHLYRADRYSFDITLVS